MKKTLLMVLLLVTIRSRGDVTLTQTFTSGGTILAGNPTGLAALGSFTQNASGAGATAVAAISVGINLTGGYNGSLAAFLVAPNGNMVTLMNQPGVGVDGFGTASSGLNITLSDNAAINIQSLTGGYGTTLAGLFQPAYAIGTLGLTPGAVAGEWQLFLASMISGGGDATLNSWSINIDLTTPSSAAPEPSSGRITFGFGLVMCAAGFRWVWQRRGASVRRQSSR